MSGGSFDYVSLSDGIEDLVKHQRQLQELCDGLAELGYARDAAMETQSLILFMRQWDVYASAICKRLGDVWKAYEWWQSNDYSENQFKKELEKYRELK